MKIIKEGKWSKKWKKEYACSNEACGAIVLVEEDDLKATENKTNDNYFNCGSCGKANYVESKDLLPRIIQKLNGKRKYYSSEL